jgi:type I restriction enzyme S subunit
MNDWQTITLGEICTIRRGASPRPIQEFFANEGIPWLKIADVTSINSRYIETTNQYIIERGKNNSVEVYPGDLIVSNSATPGIPKFLNMYACIHDGWLLISDIKINKMFLYYLFIYERKRLVSQSNGSVFNNLKTDIVRNHKVEVPKNVNQQKAIAATLSCLDDMIKLNNRTNKVLEEMAQAIFKRWFVDFEFPNEDGQPYKSSGGEMVESDLGEIPRGWRVGGLDELIDSTISGDWGKDSEQNNFTEKVVCIRGADIPEIENGNKGNAPNRYILPKNRENKSLSANELIVEISGGSPTQSTGRCALISDELINSYDVPILCTNFCRAIKFKKVYMLILHIDIGISICK